MRYTCRDYRNTYNDIQNIITVPIEQYIYIRSRLHQYTYLLFIYMSALRLNTNKHSFDLIKAIVSHDATECASLIKSMTVQDCSDNFGGCTPIHMAILHKYVAVIELLLEKRVDLDCLFDPDQSIVLDHLLKVNHLPRRTYTVKELAMHCLHEYYKLHPEALLG